MKGDRVINPCEWDPERNSKASGEIAAHAEARVAVGAGKNNWHLCESCAALPRFRRYTKRSPLKEAR